MSEIEEENVLCSKCKNMFVLIHKYYPSRLDDKRESYYVCPYCGNETRIFLQGNEDVDTRKK